MLLTLLAPSTPTETSTITTSYTMPTLAQITITIDGVPGSVETLTVQQDAPMSQVRACIA